MRKSKRNQLLVLALTTGFVLSGTTVQAMQEFALDEYVVTAKANGGEREDGRSKAKVAAAYPGGQVASSNLMGVLGRQDFLDTPFNVTGYTSQLIENKQAGTVSDVVANDASVKEHSLSGASSAWEIRGFKTTQQDMEFNGLYGILPRFYTGVESFERVEVIKGPSALLGGMPPNGSVGGTINFVPKRAGKDPIHRIKLSYGNGSQFTQHLDLGQRFGHNNKYGVRINFLNRNGETSSENEKNNVSSFTLGADVRGDRYRAALDLGYVYNEIINPQYRVLFHANYLNAAKVAGVTKVPPANSDMKYGANGTHRRITEKYGVLSGEYDLNKNWTAYGAFGMRYTSMDYLYNEFTVSALRGTAQARYRYNNQINRGTSAEVGVRGQAKTGNITHNIGISASRMDYKRFMANRTLNNVTGLNLFTQTTNWGSPIGNLNWYTKLNDANIQSGISISDRIVTADEKWQFVLGARLQKIKQTNYAINFPTSRGTSWNNGKTASSYDETAFSPAFGIVHKLNDSVAVYGNYMEGLQQGDIVNDSRNPINNGEVFKPFKAKQVEVGVKVDRGNYAATLSLFQVKLPSAIYNATTNYVEQSGEQRNRGLELNVFGEPKEGTRVLGGLLWLDSRYTKTEGGTYNGNRVDGTVKFQGVLGLEQDVKSVKGLTFTTRLNYTGPGFIDEANRMKVPGFVTWDLGARYAFKSGNTPMTVRADVYNVFDKKYWNALDRNAIYQGNGRTFMVSLSADI